MADGADFRKSQKGKALQEAYWAHARRRTARRRAHRGAAPTEARAPARGAAKPRRPVPQLSGSDRLQIVNSFIALLGGLYTHLPLKRAMYAIDPLQRLRLLARRAADMEESAFHHELEGIITRLRDAHTRYVGPARLQDSIARLPFLVEAFGEPTRYIVSRVASNRSLIRDRHFAPGVELLWWNGVPIDRAVDSYAEYETGGRPDSRRARALESLTLRSLQYGPPPDEHWVVVGYRAEDQVDREVKIPWRVIEPGRAPTAGGAKIASAHRYAMDPARESTRRAKKLLFAPTKWRAERRSVASATTNRGGSVPVGRWIPNDFEDAVGAKRMRTSSGVFGYLRLWSFDVADDQPYIEEVIRLLGRLSDTGLIIDLRANPGGLIWGAERLLQLFCPQQIFPTRFSLLATPLTRAMAGARQNRAELEPWRASLEDAVATGEPYSLPLPITRPERCNDIGQVYGGPVVAVVDANTYSAGDLFAAGFYDNGLGILVTVGEATGAGGANVWWPDQVQEALLGTEFEQRRLPGNVAYSIAVRRATRGTGEAAGAPIEDVGVRGHRPYVMTKEDLLGHNQGLLDFCGSLIAGAPLSRLKVEPTSPGAARVRVTTLAVDRLDLYIDGRPADSRPVTDGRNTIELRSGWHELELRGYHADQMRQRRRL